uniref:Uncharacterized protein n=1 Tax=Amphimedon queenslandica TaxID=400682 RepID=A0A1X7SQ09_AMPQE
QLVSHSQHTYFYSQALIKTLENRQFTQCLTGEVQRVPEIVCILYLIVSMGVFRWVESTATNPSLFEVSAETTSLVLVLLDEIASCHPLQHTYIMSLLQRLLEASYPSLEVQMQ